MCSFLHPEDPFSSEAARTECTCLDRRLWLLALAFLATIIIKEKQHVQVFILWVLEYSEKGDQEGIDRYKERDYESLAHEIMEAGPQCILCKLEAQGKPEL